MRSFLAIVLLIGLTWSLNSCRVPQGATPKITIAKPLNDASFDEDNKWNGRIDLVAIPSLPSGETLNPKLIVWERRVNSAAGNRFTNWERIGTGTAIENQRFTRPPNQNRVNYKYQIRALLTSATNGETRAEDQVTVNITFAQN